MNPDVQAAFLLLKDVWQHEMAGTAVPEETTRRYELKRYALAVEFETKGYDTTGYLSL